MCRSNENGTFTLGAVAFTAGPNVTEQYPAGANTQSFSHPGKRWRFAHGLHWNFIQDNTTNPRFFGTMTVASRIRSSSSPGQLARSYLSTSPHSGEVGTLSPVALPAALPLFMSGLVGLGLLGWRRKWKAVVAG